MECFLVKNGGGAPLNFKVVGNPQPTNPRENTIWINTDTAVTGYVFSAAAPSSPTQGMVWIAVGTSSPVEFNALKKNGIQVYPISAKQYVSGAWVGRTAKIYQGGEWHDWMFDLYVDGSEWETRALKPSSGWPHVYTPTVTKNTDGSTTVSLTVSGEGGGGVWELKNDIDVTNYKSLCIKCKVSLPSRTDAGVCAHLAVMHRSTSYWETDAAAIRTLPSENNITTYELDIASLDGAYDIAVCCRWNGAWLGTGTVAVTVYDIYLI